MSTPLFLWLHAISILLPLPFPLLPGKEIFHWCHLQFVIFLTNWIFRAFFCFHFRFRASVDVSFPGFHLIIPAFFPQCFFTLLHCFIQLLLSQLLLTDQLQLTSLHQPLSQVTPQLMPFFSPQASLRSRPETPPLQLLQHFVFSWSLPTDKHSLCFLHPSLLGTVHEGTLTWNLNSFLSLHGCWLTCWAIYFRHRSEILL